MVCAEIILHKLVCNIKNTIPKFCSKIVQKNLCRNCMANYAQFATDIFVWVTCLKLGLLYNFICIRGGTASSL